MPACWRWCLPLWPRNELRFALRIRILYTYVSSNADFIPSYHCTYLHIKISKLDLKVNRTLQKLHSNQVAHNTFSQKINSEFSRSFVTNHNEKGMSPFLGIYFFLISEKIRNSYSWKRVKLFKRPLVGVSSFIGKIPMENELQILWLTASFRHNSHS